MVELAVRPTTETESSDQCSGVACRPNGLGRREGAVIRIDGAEKYVVTTIDRAVTPPDTCCRHRCGDAPRIRSAVPPHRTRRPQYGEPAWIQPSPQVGCASPAKERPDRHAQASPSHVEACLSQAVWQTFQPLLAIRRYVGQNPARREWLLRGELPALSGKETQK